MGTSRSSTVINLVRKLSLRNIVCPAPLREPATVYSSAIRLVLNERGSHLAYMINSDVRFVVKFTDRKLRKW